MSSSICGGLGVLGFAPLRYRQNRRAERPGYLLIGYHGSYFGEQGQVQGTLKKINELTLDQLPG